MGGAACFSSGRHLLSRATRLLVDNHTHTRTHFAFLSAAAARLLAVGLSETGGESGSVGHVTGWRGHVTHGGDVAIMLYTHMQTESLSRYGLLRG